MPAALPAAPLSASHNPSGAQGLVGQLQAIKLLLLGQMLPVKEIPEGGFQGFERLPDEAASRNTKATTQQRIQGFTAKVD